MTSIGLISDTEEIVKPSCSLFQHDGVAAFKLLERSPLPPALSAKDRPGGQTHLLNVRRIETFDCHPVVNNEDSSPERISDTENWLNRNGDLDNPNHSQEDSEADIESDMELDNGKEDPESPKLWDESATPNVPGLIWPTWKSTLKAEMMLVMVNAIETRSNTGNKKT